jgi:hypothetical protein
MIVAARTSETSADNYFTRQYIQEDKYEWYVPFARILVMIFIYTDDFIYLQCSV